MGAQGNPFGKDTILVTAILCVELSNQKLLSVREVNLILMDANNVYPWRQSSDSNSSLQGIVVLLHVHDESQRGLSEETVLSTSFAMKLIGPMSLPQWRLKFTQLHAFRSYLDTLADMVSKDIKMNRSGAKISIHMKIDVTGPCN